MKANAPEKIWMGSEWIPYFDCKDCITEDSIEYTRTDALSNERRVGMGYKAEGNIIVG